MWHVARADDAKPWAAGVSAEQQKQALALYDKGNAFFSEDHYKEALEQYQLALQFWDHPAVHYNAAVCEINLDRPAEAYEDLTAAMKYGAEPIGADHFAQAKTYQKALVGQVADLEITCKEPDAELRLDGAPLSTGPITVVRHVRAGEHQLVATKPGFEPHTETIRVRPMNELGGKPNVFTIEMHELGASGRLVRRWPTWQPWAIAGGGAALAAIGGGLVWLAYSNKSDYESWVTAHCTAANNFCAGSPVPSSSLDHAKLENAMGIGALVIGGAALAVGATMIYLNQGHMIAVAPNVGTEHAGLTLLGRF